MEDKPNFIVTKKPPLGIKPRYIHEEERIADLGEAINRRIEVKQEIPIDWVSEYNELADKRVR